MSIERTRLDRESVFGFKKFGYTGIGITDPETGKYERRTISLHQLEEIKKIVGVNVLEVGEPVKIDKKQYDSVVSYLEK